MNLLNPAAGDVPVGHCVDGTLLLVHGSVRKNLTPDREDEHVLIAVAVVALFLFVVLGCCAFTT